MAALREDIGMVVDRFPLFLRYAAFALIATGANWAMQLVVLRTLPGSLAIYPALAAGTAAGFAIKYLLDKHYIFYHTSQNREQEAWVLALYLGTSILMTAGYILCQLAIYFYIGEGVTYYITGNISLFMGYASKFVLDARFVFKAHGINEVIS